MGNSEAAIAKHVQALEQHALVSESDPNQTISRLRLVNGLVQLTRAQSAGDKFAEAEESLDTIDEFALPTDAQLKFTQGREFTVLACKIGLALAEEETAELAMLRTRCLEKARRALTSAASQGFDVIKWSQRDADFQLFSKYSEASELLDWINENFGED